MQRYHALHDAWWRLVTQSRPRALSDTLACSLLSVGSLAYRAVVSLRNAAYDHGWIRSVRLPCRVVSVGNLTVGGTGKTACVELIVNTLTTLDKSVAVLSRGYGGRRGEYWLQGQGDRLLVNGREDSQEDGLADEPQLLARHLERVPIFVGPHRARTGQAACTQFGLEAVVLDDGFQHRVVQRDCDIVLIHARMPFNGWPLLPRGPMREPLASLRRAHVIVMTKADEALERLGALTERLRALNPHATFVTAVHAPSSLTDGLTNAQRDLGRLNGARVGLVSSIGDPEGFESTVRRMHATVLWHRTFPDHHVYQPSDWASIAQGQEIRPDAIVTTEKDWVRLRSTSHESRVTSPIWILRIHMKLLSGEEELHARLASLFAR